MAISNYFDKAVVKTVFQTRARQGIDDKGDKRSRCSAVVAGGLVMRISGCCDVRQKAGCIM